MQGLRAAAGRQFSSLGEYNFRVFFFGQVVSLIGVWMQAVGLAWLTLELTSSEVAVGLVTTLQFLPMMLFALVGGVVADNLPKRTTLIVVQTTAMVQAGALGVLAASGRAELWHVYVLAFVAGLLSAIERPTRQSFFVEMAGRDNLANAVGLHSSILNGSRTLGPALAGVTIAWLGVSATFFFNAVSYLAVLIGYALIRPSELHGTSGAAQREGGGVFAQIGEGLRYAARTPAPAFIFILIGFIGTFGYNFNVVIPLLARFVLNTGPAQFGLLTSALGLGSLVSALALAGAGPRSHGFLLVAAAVFSLFFTLLAVSQWYWLTGVALMLVGMAGVALMTGANTTLQLEAPEHMRGRVISIYILLMAGSTPIGGFLTGLMSNAWGVRAALGVEAAACGLGVLIALRYRWTRREAFAIRPLAVEAEAPGPAGGR